MLVYIRVVCYLFRPLFCKYLFLNLYGTLISIYALSGACDLIIGNFHQFKLVFLSIILIYNSLYLNVIKT